MSEEALKYDMMVEEALRGVVRKALRQAAAHGLPGNNHFYITFKTRHPEVEVPVYLTEKYPDEMTIVLQYQFWDLEVREDDFEVMLSFNDKRERLFIPFAAITGFADPSVKFGLQFQASGEAGEVVPSSDIVADGEVDTDTPDETGTPASQGGEVVSLDQFRKKQ